MLKSLIAVAMQYAHGFGVPQDNVLAYVWFDMAAAGGHKNAFRAKDDIAQQWHTLTSPRGVS